MKSLPAVHRFPTLSPLRRKYGHVSSQAARGEGRSVDSGALSILMSKATRQCYRRTQLWAGQWPLPREGIGTLADRIGQTFAAAVDPALGQAHQQLLVGREADPTAWDAYARVDYLLGRHTMAATRRALSQEGKGRPRSADAPNLSVHLSPRRRRGEGKAPAALRAPRAESVPAPARGPSLPSLRLPPFLPLGSRDSRTEGATSRPRPGFSAAARKQNRISIRRRGDRGVSTPSFRGRSPRRIEGSSHGTAPARVGRLDG